MGTRSKHIDSLLALGWVAGAFVILVATIDSPVITWDEGVTIRREAQMRRWFALVVDPPGNFVRSQFFSDVAINAMWPFAREEPDGHPPFYAVIGNIGWWLGNSWLDPIPAHRLGPVILFSITCGVMFLFMARRFGRLPAAASVATWLTMPRVFAHAHLASYDIPLACLWFLTVVAFWKARESWCQSAFRGAAWSFGFAVLLAIAAATKFTGWLIPIPLVVWSLATGLGAIGRTPVPRWAVGRLAACSVVLIAMVPAELSLLSGIRRVASDIESPDRADAQMRAKRAAEQFRAKQSQNPFNFGRLGLGAAAAAWLAIYATMVRKRRLRSSCNPTLDTWAAVCLVPALTVLLVPNWWHDPLRGVAIFLWSNLTRQQTTWIPTQFFGTVYEFSLPWYNSLAWVALTVPPIPLVLMVLGTLATWLGRLGNEMAGGESNSGVGADQVPAGAGRVIFTGGSLGWLLFVNGATLLVIRALPGSPGHDGERQLLGAFPFLACLAGLGVAWLCRRFRRAGAARVAPAAAVIAATLWSSAAIWHYRSAPLSYYTELIGGLRGAHKLGLEPTYYWDSFDRQAIRWLNANTGSGEKVLFCNYFESLRYLREWGLLQTEILPDGPGINRWYVLQNRPGLFLWSSEAGRVPVDRWLARRGRAAYTHGLDGVPLVWIFPFSEYERAIEQAKRTGSGPGGGAGADSP